MEKIGFWLSTGKRKRFLQNIDIPIAYKIVNCSIRYERNLSIHVVCSYYGKQL